MTRKKTAAILVLNYNGRPLLERFLDSIVIAADKAMLCDTDVTIVDNQSNDNSREFTSSKFPSVQWLSAPANRYLYSLNWAARHIEADIVILLNNDIEMTENCLDPLFEVLLQDSQVFSVTPQLLGMDRITPNGGHYVGKFQRGMLTTRLANEGIKEPRPTLFGCGGAIAVRRDDFLALGGFDELYYPAYWEDVDLSYKAWKQGKQSIYQPNAVMYHVHSASWKSDPTRHSQMSTISFQNCWLLTWRNVSATAVLRSNVYWTARHYFSVIRNNDQLALEMYRSAFSKWKVALHSRRQDEFQRKLPDQAILEEANGKF